MLQEVWQNHKTLRNTNQSGGLLQFDTKTWLQFESNSSTQRRKIRGLNDLKDLENLKQEKPPSQRKHEPLQRAQPIENLNSCKGLLGYVATRFAEQTSITALYRLLSVGTNKRARALWCIGFFLALVLLLYTSAFIAARYNKKQFETIIDTTNLPVFKIPFPELVFCNEDRLNWARLPEAKRRFLWREHHMEPYETLFTQVLLQYNNLIFGDFNKFAFLTNNTLLKELNYINFTNVVEFMSWRCNEMFEDCVWRNRPYNCCDIIFPRRSQMGLCLAFNSVESPEGKQKQKDDPMWPWRLTDSGPGTGLQLKVLLPKQLNGSINGLPRGVKFMVLETHVWFDYPFYVAPNTRTAVTLNAIYHWYDENTRSVPSRQRKCVFKDEFESVDYNTLQGITYMYENCLSECQQSYLKNFCNCSLDLFYPPGKYPACKLVDYPCLARRNGTHRMLLYEQKEEQRFVHSLRSNNTGMVCDCLLNCYSLTYITDVRPTSLNDEEQAKTNNTEYIILDFHFRRNFILVFRTYLVFTWIDLLVSFGGIAGLFLGCSLISLIELIYFLLLDMPKLIWREHRNAQRISSWRRKSIESVRNLLNRK